MATNFLLTAGTNGFITSPYSLLTTELNGLSNGSAATSSVGGSSGVFTQSSLAQALAQGFWLTFGGSITPSLGGAIALWWLLSPDGGSTFETAVATPSTTVMALSRTPDALFALDNAAFASGNKRCANGLHLPSPWESFKVLAQNLTGSTLPSTGNIVTAGPVTNQDQPMPPIGPRTGYRRSPRGLWLPGGIPKIDWSDSITAGLQIALIATGEASSPSSASMRDYVSGRITTGITGSIRNTPFGQSGYPSGGGAGYNLNLATSISPNTTRPTNAWTVLWFGGFVGSGTANAAIAQASSSGTGKNNYGFARDASASTGIVLQSNYNSTAWSYSVSGILPSATNTPVCCILASVTATSSSGPVYVFLNGSLFANSTWGQSTAIAGYAANNGFLAGSANVRTHASFVWDRQLTLGESARITADPAGFLLLPSDVTFVSMVGASSGTTVALTGTGTLASAPSSVDEAAATLTGTGTLTAASAVTDYPTALLAGIGTLTGFAEPTLAVSATLPGSGTLTSAANPTITAAATLALTGALTGSPSPLDRVAATLSGTGTLSSQTSTPPANAAATLGAVFGLSAAALSTEEAAATLGGVLAFTATGTTRGTAAATLAGYGSISAAGLPTLDIAATLSGAGTLGASISVEAGAIFVGYGALQAATAPPSAPTVTFDGFGILTAQWSIPVPPPLPPLIALPQRISVAAFVNRGSAASFISRNASADGVSRSSQSRGP